MPLRNLAPSVDLAPDAVKAGIPSHVQFGLGLLELSSWGKNKFGATTLVVFIVPPPSPSSPSILSRNGELSGATLGQLSRVSSAQLSEKGTKIRQQHGLATLRA